MPSEIRLRKRATPGRYMNVTMQCSWCMVVGTAMTSTYQGTPEDYWLFVVCPNPHCEKPALVRIKAHKSISYSQYDPLEHGQDDVEALPHPQPVYEEPDVPAQIRLEFQEALRSRACGFLIGAALVGRRVLQAAAREAGGGTGKNLASEIEAIPDSRLNGTLKALAHEVRLIGNDAAHVDELLPAEVEQLLLFTGEVLNHLYVMPGKVQMVKQLRQGKGA